MNDCCTHFEGASRVAFAGRFFIPVLVLATVLFAYAGPARASHLAYATNCTECHSVANAEAEFGTSYISSAARTLPTMKILNGGSAPATFGCTFCHFNDVTATKKGVFSHFGSNTSKHPVGHDFSTTGDAFVGDTNGEYLTGWAPSTLQADELDCVDCHDASMLNTTGVDDGVAYADHDTPGVGARVANPYMLIGGGSLTALCTTCHGSAAGPVEGTDVRVTSHADAALAESDGTPIKTSACADCHDTHYSNNFKLFNDGHEGDTPIDMGTDTDCSNIYCHERGDVNNNYDNHGHGMATSTGGTPLNFQCGSCHSVDARHDGATAKMFNFSEDPALSTFGKSLTSICYVCHNGSDYAAHGAVNVGCIDCHDEHAEGSGSTSNIYMIPQMLPNRTPAQGPREAVFYENSGPATFDFYRGTPPVPGPFSYSDDGLCDNTVCHGGVNAPSGAPLAPLYDPGPADALMEASQHTGANRDPNYDCSSCHSHTDPSGSWSASASCTSCHGQPPVSAATQEAGYADHSESASPHAKHALAPASGGYGFACTECHNAFTNAASHDAGGTYDSIWFDQATNPQTTAYTVDPGFPTTPNNYNQVTETCTNLYCHSDGQDPVLSIGSQQWMTGFATPDYSSVDLGCGACHAATPPTGSHALHIAAGAGCQNCHFATTSDGTTINLTGGQHVDRTKDLAAGGTFNGNAVSFGWASPNCSNISCHGGYADVAWGAASNCANCHGTFVAGMPTTVAAKHRSTDWTDPNGDLAVTRFDVSHRGSATGGGNGEEFCDYCHANTQPAYTAGMHMDNTIQLNNQMSYQGISGPGGGDGCASACHAQGAPFQMNDTGYTFQTIAGQGFGCGSCHNDGTVPPTSGAHTVHLDSARQAAWTNSGDFTACEACHGLPPNGVSNTGWAANSYDHNDTTLAFANSGTGNGETWDVTYNDQGTGPVADDTCSTSDCHSDSGRGQTAVWGLPASVNCDHCHYYNLAAPSAAANSGANWALTGSHNAHFSVQATGNTLVCTDCHGNWAGQTGQRAHINDATGGDDRTRLTGMARALQNEATVTGAALGGGGSDPDPGNPTCNNTECHNPSNDGHISNAWGTANAGCEMCHNSSTAPASNPVGSHPEHVTTKAYACTECHPNNTGIGPAHYNSTVDFPAFTYNGDANNYPGSYGSCTNACHGGGLVWGATPTNCSDCHLTAGADVNNFDAVDSTATIINSNEWTNYGHGAKAVDCLDCHTFSAAHVNTSDLAGANPFRLIDQDGGTGGVQFSCAYTGVGCHEPGTTGPATGADISTFVTHDDSTMSGTKRTWPGWDPDCLNCHDPHGDGANLSMIQRELYDKAAFNVPAGPAPTPPTEQTNLIFTDDSTGATSGGASFADLNSPYSSVCQECHEDASMVSFADGSTASGANHPTTGGNPGDCSTCHPHSSGFTPSGCSGCHGDGGSQNWPDSTPADNYEDREGAHNEHVAAIGTGNASCPTCHPGNPPASHPDGSVSPARLINHDTNDDWAVDADVGSYSDLQGNADDSDGIYNDTTFTCRNIDCHGGVETPTWYFVADSSPPTWPSGDGLVVTDLVRTGFELAIDWNAADDQTGPVTYELRRSTATFGGTCSGGTQVATGLGTTGYVDTFPSDGTTYFYCVNATDSAPGGPFTAASTTNASGSATEPAGGSSSNVTYNLTSNTGSTAGSGTTNTNCASYGTAGNANPPAPYQGLLTTSTSCGTAASYRIRNGSTGAHSAFRFYGAFYRAPYASSTAVQGRSGAVVGVRGSASSNGLRVYLASVHSSGTYTFADGGNVHDATASNYVQVGTIPTAAGSVTVDLSAIPEFNVPAGDQLVALLGFVNAPGNNNYPGFGYDNDSYFSALSTIPVTETQGPPPDSTPPAFSGLNNATDQAKGGTVQLTWTATNDTGTGDSNPVVYRIWWSTSTNGDPAQGTHQASTTQAQFTVSGLTDDTPYFFLVRAEDGAGNIDTNTVELSATPTAPSGGGSATCTTCHGTAPATGAHGAHANNDADYADCDKCHGDATYSPSGTVGGTSAYTTDGPAGSLHNDGTADVYFGAIPDDATWNALAAPNDTCDNVDCHFNSTTPSWTTGSANCDTCHGYPPVVAGFTRHDQTTGNGGIGAAALRTAHSDCNVCHGISAATAGDPTSGIGTPVDKTADLGDAYDPSTMHGDGQVQMNGITAPDNGQNTAYNESLNRCDNAGCHGTGYIFNGGIRANTVQLLELGTGDCRGCHDGVTPQGTSGVNVGINSPHSETDTGFTCEDCHTAHGAGTVEIPNYTNVGINYGDNGESGISFGGAGTSGTTEADMCWNCHAAQAGAVGRDLSEWGVNFDTNGAAPNYNLGSLSTYNWFSANTWSPAEANFSYKSGNLTTALAAAGASTHTANPAGAPWNGPTGPGVDTAAQVRCSYCHDVHDTMGPTGRPYLRGTWMGNPYPEDGAPWAKNYASVTNFGAVPRGQPTTNEMGGYQIDQNNGNPTSAWTADGSSGLCSLCHGSNTDGTWNLAGSPNDIDSLNQFGTPATDWLGTNGHSYAVIGGSANYATNILSTAIRNPSGIGGSRNGTQPTMGYRNQPDGERGFGFRDVDNEGWGLSPSVSAGSEGRAFQTFSWGVTQDNSTIDPNYHNFPCSKCHNPHASRLPRLMITNCLDTNHNTWDGTGTGRPGTVDRIPNTNNQNSQPPGADNVLVEFSNATSAQNCHRMRDATWGNSTGDGWNNVTPW